MVLLYRHAKTASTEIYAGLRRGFWLPHRVGTPGFPPTRMSKSAPQAISDLSVDAVWAVSRRVLRLGDAVS
jgi:hypothetical protein